MLTLTSVESQGAGAESSAGAKITNGEVFDTLICVFATTLTRVSSITLERRIDPKNLVPEVCRVFLNISAYLSNDMLDRIL
jgi:hypothetical protein